MKQKSSENRDFIVYVLLEIYVRASHECRNCKFYKNSQKSVLWDLIEI